MTESEWLACPTAEQMMVFFRSSPSRRKFRLFAVACARQCWDFVQIAPEPQDKDALEVAERYADGLATDAERLHCLNQLEQAARNLPHTPEKVGRNLAPFTLRVGTLLIAKDVARCARVSTRQSMEYDLTNAESPRRRAATSLAEAALAREQAGLFRDIFGNPFRPVEFNPGWRTSTVVALAQQMYESRDFSVMPILADALQDAGCDHPDIVAHCRDPQPAHVRGCWVVDLILGKK